MNTDDPETLADRQSELPRLLWVLRNGKGFGLYFVCCNAPAYRRELVEKIKAEYALPILEFDLTGHDGEEYIDHRLLTWTADKPAGAPVFLFGLETLLPTRDEDRRFRTIQEINWRRNVYSQLGRNLVIWLPEYALTLLARQASDFYDWHSAVFEFPVPEAEKAEFVELSMQEFMDGETHAANRMTLAEKKRWIGVLNGLLDETPKESVEYARLLNDLGRLHHASGKYSEALRMYQKSLEVFHKLNNQEDESMALNNISQIYQAQGDYDNALRYLESSLVILRDIGFRDRESIALGNISHIYRIQGDYEKALSYLEDALVINHAMGNREGEGTNLNSISQIYSAQGYRDKALNCLENALTIHREVGNRIGEGATLNNFSNFYYDQGNNDKALDYLEQSLRIARDMGDQAGLCAILINYGAIHDSQGNISEAKHAWLEAYRIAEEIGHAEGLKALDKLAKDLGKEGLAYWESKR